MKPILPYISHKCYWKGIIFLHKAYFSALLEANMVLYIVLGNILLQANMTVLETISYISLRMYMFITEQKLPHYRFKYIFPMHFSCNVIYAAGFFFPVYQS